jgi:hypothetical protein
MDESESWYQVTISLIKFNKKQELDVDDIYMQKVDFISVKQISALVNEINEQGQIALQMSLNGEKS